ncbi:MAG: MFS transporter [Archangiaceae bacterium]|nr:MFS transporter [Archangiaceae bacterium]
MAQRLYYRTPVRQPTPEAPAAPPAPVIELTREQKIFTFVGTLLGLLLGALDQTVVATAAPTIVEKLAIPPSLYVWVTTSYMLASTVLVPVWGKLSDLYGRRLIVITGIGVFLFGSVLCGLSQDTYQLIAARALQGAGSASLFTTTFAVVADMFPPAERGKYSGVVGSVFGLSSLIGPLVGGFVTHQFGWHWVFFINLPVGAVALFFIITRMPPLKRPQAVKPSVDWVGALLLAFAVSPVLVAMSLSRHAPSEGAKAAAGGPALPVAALVAMVGAGALCLMLFIAWELKRAQPLIDLSLFKGRVFAIGNATVFVFGGVFMSPLVFLPLYMMRVQGASETAAGLAMVPMVVGIMVGNVVSGQVASRLGRYKGTMLVGLTLLTASLAVMAFTLHDDATRTEVTLKMVLVGLGLGPSIPLYTVAIQNAIPPQQIGSATGVATFFRQMGGTIGVTLAGAVFAAGFVSGIAAHRDDVTARFTGTRALLAKALAGDPAAAAQVSQQAWVDPETRVMLANGGPRALVRKSLAGSPDLERAEATADAQAREKLEARLAQAQQRELERPGYTDGVRQVYRLAFMLALLAFALTLALPSLPLRGKGPKVTSSSAA